VADSRPAQNKLDRQLQCIGGLREEAAPRPRQAPEKAGQSTAVDDFHASGTKNVADRAVFAQAKNPDPPTARGQTRQHMAEMAFRPAGLQRSDDVKQIASLRHSSRSPSRP
jgi:hypothetical protein